MAAVRIADVAKTYPNGHTAIRHADLDIGDGEFLVLVGPSGCGKSTLLRLIAGLETPTSGRVFIGGHDVTAVPPQGRDLAMVFQSYALYPHMSVRDNLAYGLKVRRTDRAVVAERVASVAAALDLGELLDRRPAQLSGGQRQRVALGRAIVREPRAFLLDEPLSNLDPALRAQARAELRRLHRRLGVTVVYVTHDQEEAMTLGGRVAVMRDGVIEQVAPPLEVYARPVNTFVARFMALPDEPDPGDAGRRRGARGLAGIRSARCHAWRRRRARHRRTGRAAATITCSTYASIHRAAIRSWWLSPGAIRHPSAASSSSRFRPSASISSRDEMAPGSDASVQAIEPVTHDSSCHRGLAHEAGGRVLG
jgi:multiple sugar transport system ATP-binding protein